MKKWISFPSSPGVAHFKPIRMLRGVRVVEMSKTHYVVFPALDVHMTYIPPGEVEGMRGWYVRSSHWDEMSGSIATRDEALAELAEWDRSRATLGPEARAELDRRETAAYVARRLAQGRR